MYWPSWLPNLGEEGGSALSPAGEVSRFVVTTLVGVTRLAVTPGGEVGRLAVTSVVGVVVEVVVGALTQVPVSVPVIPLKVMVPVRLLTVKIPFGYIVTCPLKLKVVPPEVEAF